MKRLYALDVRGKLHEWQFEIEAEDAHAAEWRADSLLISEIVASIPQWWVWLGLPAGWWVALRDIVSFKRSG